MPLIRTYDPQLVVAVLGSIEIRGWAPGTMITVARNTDAFSIDVGAQGDALWIRSRDRTGLVTFNLQLASPTNDELSQLARDDEKFGTGAVPFMLKFLNGTTICDGESARILKFSDVGYGAEAEAREWRVGVADLNMHVGGNIV